MTVLFVTGTDTGVGKTRVATGICRALASRGLTVAAMKPVASGCSATAHGPRNADALALMAAANVPLAYGDVNPYAFLPAIAPHIAAREAGVQIDFAHLDVHFERLRRCCSCLIVEGAGGWLAPLDATRTFADLAARWHLGVLLVVGLRLGCLNHALLTVEAVARRGLRLRGWVGSAIDPDFERLPQNVASLEERIAAPCLGVIPYDPDEQLARPLAGLRLPALWEALELS